MLKITKVLALIICLCLSSVFTQAQENSLNFLSESVMDFDNIDPKNAEQFIQGYLAGIEVFDNVSANSTCIQSGEVIIEDSIKLFNLLKNLKVDFHIYTTVKEIIAATQSIVSHFKNEEDQCVLASQIALVDIHRIVDRIGQDGYVTELGSHIYHNIGAIETLLQNGYTSFHEGNFLEAGLNFGKFTKFVGFWDVSA